MRNKVGFSPPTYIFLLINNYNFISFQRDGVQITFDKSCVSTSIKIYASYMYSVHTFNHLFVYDRGFFFTRTEDHLTLIIFCIAKTIIWKWIWECNYIFSNIKHIQWKFIITCQENTIVILCKKEKSFVLINKCFHLLSKVPVEYCLLTIISVPKAYFFYVVKLAKVYP